MAVKKIYVLWCHTGDADSEDVVLVRAFSNHEAAVAEWDRCGQEGERLSVRYTHIPLTLRDRTAARQEIQRANIGLRGLTDLQASPSWGIDEVELEE